MSEYLKDINEFWEQYFSQYNSIYDELTLRAIIKNNDTTAFLHPMDYAYFQKHFGDNFTEIPRFKKMIDFANGKVTLNKDRQRVTFENADLNPAIARPYFGNPEIADIVILKKQPENDFQTYQLNLANDEAIEYRKRILLDIQGKLLFNGQKLFLPYIDRHRWFVKYLYSNASTLKQFNIDPNRVMVLNFFPYQTGHSAGIPKDFLTFNHKLPSQIKNYELLIKMLKDDKPRIYIVSEEELYISIFKNFADSELCQYLIDHLFVLSSKQNRHLTVCNVLSYREHRLRIKKKQELSKIEYYRWNQEQKVARENGDSDFHEKIKKLQHTLERQI
ncbi:hypothetical protein NGC65_02440 [Staphylococcus xylosus]|nr:hypothetical protein [Staphylococcus xylosus]MEB6289705.1 hypothetical protein [Staphylococcus xylosus]MEB7383920.1 hypothetical protein [Staphylococcus xylosus]MEB7718254.1 hypothetical protein [Staphylococcus xylosus]MEB7813266.1 hypothetical protein [Staphylococcus xylosus]MEB7821285.1 hypothetical protein [Staphylococcus xylosus]